MNQARRPPAETGPWDELRRRLAASRREIARLSGADPAAEAELLVRRARELASAATPQTTDDEAGIAALGFEAGGERYAVAAHHVAHVCALAPLTPIPGTPAFVAGVAAIQGDIVSVVDLRALLALSCTKLVDATSVIVLRSDTMEFGVLAEAVTGIARYPLQGLDAELPTLSPQLKRFLQGVAPDRTIVIDGARLLADPALVVDFD